MPPTAQSDKLKKLWAIAFVLLFAASLSQGVDTSNAFGLDILFHVAIYGILSAVPLIVIKKRLTAFILTLAVAPLGFLFETIHGNTTGYGFKMLDAFFNNLGIMTGIVIGIFVRLRNR